jgi:hypothetical protein
MIPRQKIELSNYICYDRFFFGIWNEEPPLLPLSLLVSISLRFFGMCKEESVSGTIFSLLLSSEDSIFFL